MAIIAINNTGSRILIEDLGKFIDSSASVDLTDIFEKEEISSSDDLLVYVLSGDITINDGTQDLNISDGIKQITIQTEWEDLEELPPHALDQHTDVPPKPETGETVLQCDDGTNTWIITPPTINSIDDIPGVPEVPASGDNYLRIEDGVIKWGSSPSKSPSVQVRRSTQYSDIPLTWTDFYFDLTDIETYSDVLEHDDVNQDRILIKEKGLYQIGYHFDFDDQVEVRVRINDTTVINGSYRNCGELGDVNDFQGTASNAFFVNLTENDYITMQVMSSSTAENIMIDANLIINKMEGISGVPGPPGGTIQVNDNGTEVVEFANVMNFEGGVDVTADSTSSVTINISGVPEELPAVEARRTTNYNCTTTFTDILFDQTDVENNTDVIYHDNSNTDRIYVEEDGIYCVYYKSQMMATGSTRRSEARVRVNDSDVIPASEGFLNSYQNEIHHMTDIFVVELDADDYITLQLRSTSTPVIAYPPSILGIFKLKGSKGSQGDKGEKGDPGSGAAPNIFKDDSLVVGNVEEINFEGDNITVTEDSTSKVTITVDESGGFTPKIIQCYNTTSVNINQATPQAISWGGEDVKDDDYYSHSNSSNNTRIYADVAGYYKLTYSINTDNADNSRTTIRTRVRRDGSTYEDRGTAYSYMRNTTDDKATNNASFIINLSANEYVEILGDQEGSSGTTGTIIDESWISLEFIR